jgi:peroxiredoxin
VGLQAGQLAPELEGFHDGQKVGLTDLSGKPVKLADLRGHPVWLNFWATWCPPCQEETPVLRDTFAAYRDRGLAVVAVSVQETSVEDVKNYVNTYGLDYTVGFDATSAVFHTYHAFGLPTQVFIDGDGVIQKVIYGPVTREQAAAISRRC